MSLPIQVRNENGATVVTLAGPADASALASHSNAADVPEEADVTGATTPTTGEIHAGSEVATAVNFIGVRCRSCERLHLPARLWPLAIRPGLGGGAEVDLRCVRCDAAGTLLLDGERPEHAGLLEMWRDQVPSDDGSVRRRA